MEAIIALAVFLFVALQVIVHVAFAVGINKAATEDERIDAGPLCVSVPVWTLATLLGGPFVAGLYWAMHHSTLRPQSDRDPQESTS